LDELLIFWGGTPGLRGEPLHDLASGVVLPGQAVETQNISVVEMTPSFHVSIPAACHIKQASRP
jgi:hypothetical protein